MITRRMLLGASAAGVAGFVAYRLGARPIAPPPSHYVCIIGSGFAGVFLGLRLAERGIRTVIVEAGPLRLDPSVPDGATHLFPCRSTGDVEFPVDFNRTIAVGGTSSKWNGVVTRLLPSDLRALSEFGLFADWPLGYDALAPYYCEAERLLGTTGAPPVADAERPRACPYPRETTDPGFPRGLFPERERAFFPLAFSLRGGRPLRLVAEEVPRFAAMPGAALLPERPAVRLVCEDGQSIDSVEVRRPDGSLERIRARHFVVAAGVVESARLLLASRSRCFPDGIGNARGLLGRGFHAHPVYRVRLPASPALALPGTGHHRSYQLANELRRRGAAAIHFDVHWRPAEPDFDLVLEMEPHAASRIALDGAAPDPFGRPGATLELRWSEVDRRTRQLGRELQSSLEAGFTRRGEAVGERRVIWFHPAGGCPMGTGPESGVIDANGRVFGVENLYVAAAAFPTSGSANPTLTIVALALRLGDHLSAQRA